MFTFEPRLAWDEATQTVARGSVATVHTLTDTTHATPLPIYDDGGVIIDSGTVDAGPVGVYRGFKQPDEPIVNLWDGANESTVWSVEGREGPQGPPGADGASDMVVAGYVDDPASALTSSLEATYATKMELTEDPARPGIYTLSYNWTTEDPARPGIYTIGA